MHGPVGIDRKGLILMRVAVNFHKCRVFLFPSIGDCNAPVYHKFLENTSPPPAKQGTSSPQFASQEREIYPESLAFVDLKRSTVKYLSSSLGKFGYMRVRNRLLILANLMK